MSIPATRAIRLPPRLRKFIVEGGADSHPER
jgi:hypothetical protein